MSAELNGSTRRGDSTEGTDSTYRSTQQYEYSLWADAYDGKTGGQTSTSSTEGSPEEEEFITFTPLAAYQGSSDSGQSTAGSAPIADAAGDSQPLLQGIEEPRSYVNQTLMADLEAAAITNDHARAIVAYLSDDDIDFSDPMVQAMTLIIQSHPEYQERLAEAALVATEDHSIQQLCEVIGDAVVKHPELLENLRDEVLVPAWSGGDDHAKRVAADLLLSMPQLWTPFDTVRAAHMLQLDQVSRFPVALEQAPQSVRDWFLHRASEFYFSDAHDESDARIAYFHLENSLTPEQRRELASDENAYKLAEINDYVMRGWGQVWYRQAPEVSDTESEDYVSVSLDGQAEIIEGEISPEKLFAGWGVDSDLHAAEIEQAVATYGMETLLAVDRRLALYNSLSPELREELVGTPITIPEQQLAGVVLNGRLGEAGAIGSFLLDEPALETAFENLRTTNENELIDAQESLEEQRQEFDETLDALIENAEDGPGFIAQLDHLSDLPFEFVFGELRLDGREQYESDQLELVGRVVGEGISVAPLEQDLAHHMQRQSDLSFSEDVYGFQFLTQNNGSQDQLDFMALSMLDRYGSERLETAAPDIWNRLIDGGFTRLMENGLVQSDQIEQFSENPEARFQQALSVLTGLEQSDSNGSLDLGFRRDQALAVVDNDPSIVALQQRVMSFGDDFETINRLLAAGDAGTAYQPYVDQVQLSAEELLRMLEQVSPEEILNLERTIVSLHEAEMQSQDDEETSSALQSRRVALQNLHNLLDPDTPTSQAYRDMLKSIGTSAFSADTVTNWLKQNGPVIAAGTLAFAGTVAFYNPTTTWLGAIMRGAGAAVLATQGTREVLHYINHNIHDTGYGVYNDRSAPGAWVASHDFSSESASDLFGSFVGEVVAPLSMEYGQNVLFAAVGLGASRLGQEGLKGFSRQWFSSIVQRSQTLAPTGASATTAQAFTRQWMSQLAGRTGLREVGEELIEEGAEDLLSDAIEQAAGGDGTMGAMLLTVSTSLLQGRINGASCNVESDNHVSVDQDSLQIMVDDLRNSGFQVVQVSDEQYSVCAYGSTDTLTIDGGLETEISQSDGVPSNTIPSTQGQMSNNVQTTVDVDADVQPIRAGSDSADTPVNDTTRIGFAGREFFLTQNNCSIDIGRNMIGNGTDKTVGERHMTISRNDEGQVFVEDHSEFGTFVNGVRIRQGIQVPLQAGDIISVGDTGQFEIPIEIEQGIDPPVGSIEADVFRLREEFADLGRVVAPADYLPSQAAVNQSLQYSEYLKIDRPLLDGFFDPGPEHLNQIEAYGSSTSEEIRDGINWKYHSTIADVENDPILRRTIEIAEERFGHLPRLERAIELNRFVRTLMEPGQISDDQYTEFLKNNRDEFLFLGNFIRDGNGVCAQQALLMKVLGDQLGLEVSLVTGRVGDPEIVGNDPNHAWTEVVIDGETLAFDPRQHIHGLPYGHPRTHSHTPGVQMMVFQ